MFLFLYEIYLAFHLCMDSQMSLLSHRTSLEHIPSQLRLQRRAPCVAPPIFEFRCYYNIQPLPIYFTIIYVRKRYVTPGIRCDVRNNDVLTPYITPVQFTTPPTTLSICTYLMRRNVMRRYKFCRLIYKHNTSLCSHSHCSIFFV